MAYYTVLKKCRVCGSKNLAKKANAEDIRTINSLFTEDLARKIKKREGIVKLILATNVIAHIHNLGDLMKGVKLLIRDQGKLITEFPYLPELIRKVEFDTIYHEHLSYFSLTPFKKLLSKHNLDLLDVQKLNVHGGSIRTLIGSDGIENINSKVDQFILTEKRLNLLNIETFLDFAVKVDRKRQDLNKLLKRLKKQNKRIVGYGASAKGNVLLNFCKIGSETLEYIVDSIPYKHGKFTPGTHIPIYPKKRLEKDKPDYILILAWNFAEEIIEKIKRVHPKSKAIITVPKLTII